ncbi:MAG: 50S ribosome-binding GTPase, partial [Proteobacteria bacterium]|nr:50S ribosome-binding GTPase [Pseudomonadota bacterium]
RMTEAEVLAKDMLFATLDPTTRAIALPHGLKIVLSDTVGFISDLPTQLVAAFRATLEDVISAQIILHVRDIANADTEAQELDVKQVLGDLGITGAATQRIIEVWNKADLLEPKEALRLAEVATRRGEGAPVLVSALTGQGVEALLEEIERRLAQGRQTLKVVLPPDDGAGLAWLYENAEVLSRKVGRTGKITLLVRVGASEVERFSRRFGASITLHHG